MSLVPSRRAAAAAAAVLVAVLGVITSAAYACVPVPLVFVRVVAGSQPGDVVAVTAARMGNGTTELRWNALDGPLLGTGPGGDFQAEVTIPQVAPGVYVVVALARGQDGAIGAVAAAPVQVTGPPPIDAGSRASAAGAADDGPGLAIALGVAGLVVGAGSTLAFRRRRRIPLAAPAPAPLAGAGRP